jgi:hypothetical protein
MGLVFFRKNSWGLGLKGLRLHGIALVTKWVAREMEGNEPWKVLLINNIQIVVPK